MSGTLSACRGRRGVFPRAPRVPEGRFQTELGHRLRHPFLRTLRSTPLDRIADIFNFFFRLRVVQPRHIVGRFGRRPRAQDLLLLGIAVPADVDARPPPILGPFDQRRAFGVSFHVPNQGEKMAVRFDRERFVAALLEVTVSHRTRAGVITLRVRQGKALQKSRPVAVTARRQHQVPMVGHPAVSQNAQGHERESLPQDTEKILILRVALEQPRTKIRPLQSVVHHLANIHPLHSTHAGILPLSPTKEKGT